MKNFVETMIGKEMYPIDNSQSFNIRTGEQAHLAGRYDESAKKVKIVSEPYKLKYSFIGNEYEGEFVTVLHEGELYTVLNMFNEKQQEEWLYPEVVNHSHFLFQ